MDGWMKRLIHSYVAGYNDGLMIAGWLDNWIKRQIDKVS